MNKRRLDCLDDASCQPAWCKIKGMSGLVATTATMPALTRMRGMLMRRLAILLAIIVLSLIALARAGDALVDWLWFSSIGYVAVFWTILTTRLVLFFTVLAASAGLFWLSG